MSDLGQSLSAIVVTYNSADVIGECVGSIRRFLPNAEIVVVNNGPEDGTSDAARAEAADVSVLSGHGNVGFGAACNLGAAESSQDRNLLLFLNPDAVVRSIDEGTLEALATKKDFIAALSQDEPEPDPISDEAGAFGVWWRETYNHFLKPQNWPSAQPRRLGVNPWVGFSAVVMDRRTFDQVGGFSDLFFVYYEDRDFCRRARAKGVDITTSNAAVVAHAGGKGSDITVNERAVLSHLGMLQYLSTSHGRPVGQLAAVASIAILGLLEAVLLARAVLPRKLKMRLTAKESQVSGALSAAVRFISVAGQPEAANPSLRRHSTNWSSA